MAKGGSQLAQLKSQVRSSGINDRRQQSSAAKKRKRGNASGEKDEAAARREALARIAADSTFNPFDQKVTKQKHQVLGQRVKGAVGRPALANQGGLAQRKAMLLPEYQNRNKSGTFIDRRFGEADEGMTPEERMLERFTKEKQRQAKGGKKAALFNLNDEDGAQQEEEELTHFGRSLSAMGKLPELSMMDQDDGGIDNESTALNHFGGFEAEDADADPDRVKTKAEVMREVMAKSKMHKMERQQMRDADDELRAQLDDELGDIRGLLMAGPSQPKKDPSSEETRPDPKPLLAKPATSDYDKFVRELAFERRAKPTDRLKTEAEVAEEEAEELRKAEKARLRRMRGEESDSDDEGGKSKSRRAPQGDDLEDDFDIHGQTAAEVYGLGSGLGGEDADDDLDQSRGEDEKEDDGDDDEEAAQSEDESDDDGEQDPALEEDGYGEAISEDEEAGSADDSDTEVLPLASTSKATKNTAKKVKTSSSKAAGTVPFTFECPLSHADFADILDKHSLSPSQVPLVIKRIRALHHPSLAEDNKFKLQAFLGVLLDHALYTAAMAVAASSQPERKEHLALIDHLAKPIFELTTTYPIASSRSFVEKLSLMERNLTKGLSKGALRPEARTWPGAPELTVLRIAGLIWPTSDLNHAVATPLALLCAHYLGHCRVRSYADLTSGLYLVSLVLQQQADARRMVPEALNFLQNSLLLLLPMSSKGKGLARQICVEAAVPMPDFGEEHARSLSFASYKGASPESGRAELFALLNGSTKGAQAAVDLLRMTLELVQEFSTLYRGTAAFIELFSPLAGVLELDVVVEKRYLPKDLLDRVVSTRSRLTELLEEAQRHRKPLLLHAHRAIPLASFIPKFDSSARGSGSFRFDPDSARSEASKLAALVKKEKKGAIRELRKDSQFLSQEKAREKRKEDEEYKRKMGKIVSGLGEERSEEKQLQREKDRLRKKAAGK